MKSFVFILEKKRYWIQHEIRHQYFLPQKSEFIVFLFSETIISPHINDCNTCFHTLEMYFCQIYSYTLCVRFCDWSDENQQFDLPTFLQKVDVGLDHLGCPLRKQSAQSLHFRLQNLWKIRHISWSFVRRQNLKRISQKFSVLNQNKRF